MANSWGNNGNNETLFLGGSKITTDGDCSHEIKRGLLLGEKKAMTNLDSILKSRDINLPTKVHLVKAMVFPVVMNGCELNHKESWALKNWCYWTAVFEKTLESLLHCEEIQPVHPKGYQSWVFIGRTYTEAETPIFGHLMGRTDSLKKTLMLGKIEVRRRRGHRGWDGWMISQTQQTWIWPSSGSCWWTGKPGVLQSMASQRVRQDWETELNSLKKYL